MKLHNTLTRRKDEFVPLKCSGKALASTPAGPTVWHVRPRRELPRSTSSPDTLRCAMWSIWGTTVMARDERHRRRTPHERRRHRRGQARQRALGWRKETGARSPGSTKSASTTAAQLHRATAHRRGHRPYPDMIELVPAHRGKRVRLLSTSVGLIFDTGKYPEYALLSRLNLAEQQAGARTQVDPERRNPSDFALWITNQPKHLMQWDSPWGRGFPGWHLECSAMSIKYLGERFDIHTGGIDHVPVHHTNERAQNFTPPPARRSSCAGCTTPSWSSAMPGWASRKATS